MIRLLPIALAAIFFQIALGMGGCPTATYKVTFRGNFTARNVPGTPSNAHFSPLTVASHSTRFSVLSQLGYASPGVQAIAETGNNAVLMGELSSATAMPFVKAVVATDGMFVGDSEASVVVMVDCNMPVITALSMVAPSPDWIVAAANINMWNGRFFYERMSGKLNIYDAGTDSGESFTAEDMPTSPVENIAPLGAPLDVPVAEYVIERMRSGCRNVKYEVTVENMWTSDRFLSAPGDNVFSPLTAFSHGRRFSAFALSGYASPGVQMIAEAGDNSVFLTELAAENAAPFVLSVNTTDGPAPMGTSFTTTVEVDCMNSYVSLISMLAPSPDWIVAKSAINTMDGSRFLRRLSGKLFVYDAGTDSGTTPLAENNPTSPRENIAMLQGEPFNGRHVGYYVLRRMF